MSDLTYPEIAEAEWRELEKAAGHPLLRLEQVHKFRRRQLADRALEDLLSSFRSENRRRERRDD
jgi:hypothetical protein